MDELLKALEEAKRESLAPELQLMTEIRDLMAELVRLHRPGQWRTNWPPVVSTPAVSTTTINMSGIVSYAGGTR